MRTGGSDAGLRGKCDSHAVEGRKHAALGAAKRGQPKGHQPALQGPEIAAAKGQVMGEIEGAHGEGAPLELRAPALERRFSVRSHDGTERVTSSGGRLLHCKAVFHPTWSWSGR